MHNHTAMPTVTFGEDTDYSSLWAMLWHVGMGVALGNRNGGVSHAEAEAMVDAGREGSLFDFVLTDGTVYTGMMCHGRDSGDDMSVRVWADGRATDRVVTFDTDLLATVVYL